MALPFVTRTDVVVRGALDGLAARHRVFLNNIANIETPGFEPGDVPFEAQLQRLRDEVGREPGAVETAPRLRLEEVPAPQELSRVDGNGVQADQQVVRLAENTLTYEALTQAARMRLDLLRSVITEGRK